VIRRWLTHFIRPQFKQSSFDIAMTFFRQFLSGALQLGMLIAVARILGTEGAGQLSLALLLPTILTLVLSVGLPSANIYFVASGQISLLAAWQGSRTLLFWLATCGVVLTGLILLIFGKTVLPNLTNEAMAMGVAIFPPMLIFGVVLSLLQAKQNFGAYNRLLLIQPIATLIGLVIVWHSQLFELNNILAVVLISNLIAMVAALVALSRHVTLWSRATVPSAYFKKALPYGIQTYLGNAVMLLNYRLDIFLVNLFLGAGSAGIYTVAIRLVEQIWIVSTSISTVLGAKMASLKNDRKQQIENMIFFASLSACVTLLFGVVLALIARPLIDILFGIEFGGSAHIIYALLPGVIMFSASRVLANDLASRGLVRINLYLALGLLVVNMVGYFLVLPIYGLVGAAAVTSSSYAIDCFIRIFMIRCSRITAVN
jgi:O-antigen/teichoic acid export membrane protein